MFLLSPPTFGWDAAILLLLSGSLSVVVAATLWLRIPRHRLPLSRSCVRIIQGLSCMSFLLVAYGSFLEPHILVTRRFSVPFPFAEPMKIAVVSDLHVGPYKGKDWIARVVQHVNQHLPDMVLIPGDFIFDAQTDLEELSPLAELRAPHGVFAVIGNHDDGHYLSLLRSPYTLPDRSRDLTTMLERMNIHVLRNTHAFVDIGDQQIAVAGIDDLWSNGSNIAGALTGIPDAVPVILVSHQPDVILQEKSKRAALIVTGHTHGGQIRLPLLGPVASLPTSLGRSYDQGLFPIGDRTTLAITRGAGETMVRARLFAWPEVMLLTTSSQ